MLPVPLRVTEMHQRSNGNEEVERELEYFEVRATHFESGLSRWATEVVVLDGGDLERKQAPRPVAVYFAWTGG